jgi:hypothetical protein
MMTGTLAQVDALCSAHPFVLQPSNAALELAIAVKMFPA